MRKRWQEELANSHHARIYGAEADAIDSITTFTRPAHQRSQARGLAVIDYGFASSANESIDQGLAEFLDRVGVPLPSIAAAYDAAACSLDRLWFLIAPEGGGKQILSDIRLVKDGLKAVEPAIGKDSGKGDLGAVLDTDDRRRELEGQIDISGIGLETPSGRLKFVRDLGRVFLKASIGRHVPPPPVVGLQH